MNNTIHLSVLVNGLSRPLLSMKWEIRKGDALSPYLFIMVDEILGGNFLFLMARCEITRINPTMTLPPRFSIRLLMTYFFMEFLS